MRLALVVFEVRLPAESRHEPWRGYDRETVDQVKARLATSAAATRRSVLLYERRHKRRKGVLSLVSEPRAAATAREG